LAIGLDRSTGRILDDAEIVVKMAPGWGFPCRQLGWPE